MVAAIQTTEVFDEWFAKLRDRAAKARIQLRIDRLAFGNPGQHRNLKNGVAELKIDHGPGYRVYYVTRSRHHLCAVVRRRQDLAAERHRTGPIHGVSPMTMHLKRSNPTSTGDERMSSKIKTRAWESAEHLRDEEDIRHYIEAALEEAPDDAAFMAVVLGNVARARNMAELARESGIARETLYKVTRGEGNPTLDTISRLAKSLGFRLTLTPLTTAASLSVPVAVKKGRVEQPSAPKSASKAKKSGVKGKSA